LFFFFFQAEDGIRDFHVTGVQTCALPILEATQADVSSLKEVVVGGAACPPSLMKAFEEKFGITVLHAWGMTETSPLGSVARPPRSEERRVGKESRLR